MRPVYFQNPPDGTGPFCLSQASNNSASGFIPGTFTLQQLSHDGDGHTRDPAARDSDTLGIVSVAVSI